MASDDRKALEAKIQQCVRDARDAMGQGAPTYDHAMAEMQATIGFLNDLGNQEIAQAHNELTRQTQRLASATRRLNIVTWILFFATLGLFLVKAYEILHH